MWRNCNDTGSHASLVWLAEAKAQDKEDDDDDDDDEEEDEEEVEEVGAPSRSRSTYQHHKWSGWRCTKSASSCTVGFSRISASFSPDKYVESLSPLPTLLLSEPLVCREPTSAAPVVAEDDDGGADDPDARAFEGDPQSFAGDDVGCSERPPLPFAKGMGDAEGVL